MFIFPMVGTFQRCLTGTSSLPLGGLHLFSVKHRWSVSLLLIRSVPEPTSPRVQCPTVVWAAFHRLGPPNKTPVWIRRGEKMGCTKHVGPQHTVTASHCLFTFTLLSLCIHKICHVSHTSLLHVFVCVHISQCIYILTLIFYVEDQHPNHCCHQEAYILAFTDIILIAYVLDGFFFWSSEATQLKNKQAISSKLRIH